MLRVRWKRLLANLILGCVKLKYGVFLGDDDDFFLVNNVILTQILIDESFICCA